jgi:hypothetical protein
MQEEFKTCPDIQNILISNLGNVKDNDGNIIELITIKTGYVSVKLNNKYQYVHRLVALAFIPNPENKRCVDHIDHNRSNNNLSNLRWATHGENGKNKKLSVKNTSGYPALAYNTTLIIKNGVQLLDIITNPYFWAGIILRIKQ